MKNLCFALFAILGVVLSAVAGDIQFKVGECWSYKTRAGEEASFIVIQKIESLPKEGEVVHISVCDVKIKTAAAEKGIVDKIGHLPIAGASLRSSLKERVTKTIPETEWKQGYKIWREAYDAGKAGVFTQSVSDCVVYMDNVLSSRK